MNELITSIYIQNYHNLKKQNSEKIATQLALKAEYPMQFLNPDILSILTLKIEAISENTMEITSKIPHKYVEIAKCFERF